jgi:uncharacterized membrane protein YgaE (UPF0421/DUF939 family)
MNRQYLPWLKKSLAHPARMTIAALVASLAAQLLGMQQAYWAPIAALIVVQSDSSAMLGTSWLLLVGTALGVCAGALLAKYVGPGVIVLGLGVFGVGLFSALLRLDRRANHFAAVALIIVVLAGPADLAWHRALNRFIEFSVGIVSALLISLLKFEQQSSQANIQDQKH